MAKILKAKPLPHVVVCDTNILWYEDKGPIANPAFDQFWDAVSKEFVLEFYIPDIVKGELLFQHFTSCDKLLKSTEESLKKISAIAAVQHSTRLNADKIQKQIAAKFDKWIKAKRGIVLPLPVSQIDWKRIAHDAVWRISPFIAKPKNPDSEKGFRDALILETVCAYAASEARKVNIAFLCNDNALRAAALARLKTDQRFTAYDSLKGFETYLRLTKEKLTNEFISKIISKARVRFFQKDDPTCLVSRDSLLLRLQTDYKEYFEDITKSEKAGVFLLGGGFNASAWTPIGNGTYWITSPEFLKMEPGQRYYWKSTIKYVRLYTRTRTGMSSLDWSATISGAELSSEKVLALPFHVTWSAMVKNDARFHDLKVEGIVLEDNNFYVPTEEDIKTYHLRPTPPEASSAGSTPDT